MTTPRRSATPRGALIATAYALAACSLLAVATPTEAQTKRRSLLLTMAADSAADRPDPVAGSRILVSLEERRLWLVLRNDTLLSVPVAIGTGNNFSFNGKSYTFKTPKGTRRVLGKEEDPIWTAPDWHYYEKAAARGLEAIHVKPGTEYDLGDGSHLTMVDDQVGRVNHFGNFWPFTPGYDIIFDGKIYIPPIASAQRRIPQALGPYKLDTGDGYLIHGTHVWNEESIGLAASHGCIRMHNEDLERLYYMVEPGTQVVIF